uniref:Gypsy retrotransposon integrase-like protein 1 n=1 Tax=Xiphophorus couchianus TaxID=32473 RepID=A0A3B5L8T8_9TELE
YIYYATVVLCNPLVIMLKIKPKKSQLKYAEKFTIHAGDLFYGALPERRAIRSKEEAWNLFKEFHASPMGGHTGIVKTRIAMCSRFYWPGMTADIEKWVCQRTSVHKGVWELIGIDLTGPMPLTSCGNQYILTATDYFSKWVEAFPLKTKTAEEVCQKLCSIFYWHGCPQCILTDQGREFMNSRLCDLLSIQRSITAAYHPQTNGLDEKTNDNIKRALRKLVNDKQDDWDMFLEATLFSLRSKTHTTTKYSLFFLMHGREARFPSEVPVDMPVRFCYITVYICTIFVFLYYYICTVFAWKSECIKVLSLYIMLKFQQSRNPTADQDRRSGPWQGHPVLFPVVSLSSSISPCQVLSVVFP